MGKGIDNLRYREMEVEDGSLPLSWEMPGLLPGVFQI